MWPFLGCGRFCSSLHGGHATMHSCTQHALVHVVSATCARCDAAGPSSLMPPPCTPMMAKSRMSRGSVTVRKGCAPLLNDARQDDRAAHRAHDGSALDPSAVAQIDPADLGMQSTAAASRRLATERIIADPGARLRHRSWCSLTTSGCVREAARGPSKWHALFQPLPHQAAHFQPIRPGPYAPNGQAQIPSRLR